MFEESEKILKADEETLEGLDVSLANIRRMHETTTIECAQLIESINKNQEAGSQSKKKGDTPRWRKLLRLF